jgi:hypothetical protein
MRLLDKYRKQLASLEQDQPAVYTIIAPGYSLEDLESYFVQALREISGIYIPGALVWIEINTPVLFGEIEKSETEINTVWLAALEAGKVDFRPFQKRVDHWKSLILNGITLFNERDKF